MKRMLVVLIYGCETVLNQAVELFLTSRKEWRVISISDRENEEYLLCAVNRIVPDVVVIENIGAIEKNIPLRLLQMYPDLRVVTIALENNSIEIYKKEKVLVKQVSDLLLAVEG